MKIFIIILFLLPCFCIAQVDTLPEWKSNEHKLTQDQIDSLAQGYIELYRPIDTCIVVIRIDTCITLQKKKSEKFLNKKKY